MDGWRLVRWIHSGRGLQVLLAVGSLALPTATAVRQQAGFQGLMTAEKLAGLAAMGKPTNLLSLIVLPQDIQAEEEMNTIDALVPEDLGVFEFDPLAMGSGADEAKEEEEERSKTTITDRI